MMSRHISGMNCRVPVEWKAQVTRKQRLILVKHLPFKQRVPGSSPGRLTNPALEINHLATRNLNTSVSEPLRFDSRVTCFAELLQSGL